MRVQAVNKKGFSLIEVLVALAIIGGVLLSVLVIRNRSLKQAFAARNLGRATLIARQLMVEAELDPELRLGKEGGIPKENSALSWEREVSEVVLDDIGKFKRIEVKVKYPAATKEQVLRIVMFSSLREEDGESEKKSE